MNTPIVTDDYSFDFTPCRHGSGAIKTDSLTDLFGLTPAEARDVISMWVADMDFPTPPFIIDALRRRMEHPVLGYTREDPAWRPAITAWLKDLHGWDVSPEWLAFIPGIVKGLGMAINVFVAPDEKVVIQPPVYHPFRLTPMANGRQVVTNPLLRRPDGTYAMDFDGLEQVVDSKCRMLVLCNPHNPAGILWDRHTLRRLASFCHAHGMVVISDEIHSDMALYGATHIPFASVSPEAADCSITFGAASKTFNMAGLVSSHAIVPNPQLRRRFFGWMQANELCEPAIFPPIATIAAFTQGHAWRRRMLRYIEGNVDLVMDYCARHIPEIKPLRPQASFLIWLDCRALGLDHDALNNFFLRSARLALNDGEMFGPQGAGHMRMNLGTSRATVLEAMHRLHAAIHPPLTKKDLPNCAEIPNFAHA